MLKKCALFWGVTQRREVILYRRFGTTYRSHIQGSRSPWRKEKGKLESSCTRIDLSFIPGLLKCAVHKSYNPLLRSISTVARIRAGRTINRDSIPGEGLLWTVTTFGFHKRQEIVWSADRLTASHEVLFHWLLGIKTRPPNPWAISWPTEVRRQLN